ncbi:MAG: ABC transporter permease, partial [Oscillospiraceae bacterium]|nr:ABC transporter permease [Oscillospiraceae bacterium]
MAFFENVAVALAGLKANKMRAFLTMLGIIIGIGSVIAISTLGSIMEKSVMDIFDSQGGSNLVGFGLTRKDDAERDYILQEDFIDLDMVKSVEEKFGDRIDTIALMSGSTSGNMTIRRKDYEVVIYGVNDGYVKQS